MDANLSAWFTELDSKDESKRIHALNSILALTEKKVEWVYEVWFSLFEKLEDKNSFQRTIAVRILCNLAKSDYENRLSSQLDQLLAHTRDESFIVSRICLQCLWKVALASPALRNLVINHLKDQFVDCVDGKHYNLIRLDILQSMQMLAAAAQDDAILFSARKLAASEIEKKYRLAYEKILFRMDAGY